MKNRILGGANTCTAPINWPNWSVGDTRIVPLIITPFGSFGGSGNDIVPVIDFGAFYVTGWNGDPCPGAHPIRRAISPATSSSTRRRIHMAPAQPVCDPDALTPCVAVLTQKNEGERSCKSQPSSCRHEGGRCLQRC